MAFSLVAARVPSLGDWLGSGLSPRMDQGSYAVLDARDNSTSGNTVNMFIDAAEDDFGYAASIISACADTTVYALQCTSAPADSDIGSQTCGPNAEIITVTSGASIYDFSSAITSVEDGVTASGTAQETCVLASTTAATCTATLQVTAQGTSLSTSSVETLSGSTYYRFDVAITGGAEKTANPTKCASKGAAANLDTRKMAVWALAGVFGVASIQMMF